MPGAGLRLPGLEQEFRAIVCITPARSVPAAIISRELNIRLIETVCIASYHDYVNQGEMNLLRAFAADLTRMAAQACWWSTI